MNLKDEKLVNGLQRNDYQVLDHIYAQFLPKISPMILRNRGNADDVQDIFQEALVVLYKRLQEPDFEITGSFFTYFYGICKFLWLRQLKKKSRSEVTLDEKMELPEEAKIERQIFETERRQFYQEKFRELSAECQQVLQLFFDGKPLKKIAKLMGYTEVFVKSKKYRCKEKLSRLIQKDQRFSEYK